MLAVTITLFISLVVGSFSDAALANKVFFGYLWSILPMALLRAWLTLKHYWKEAAHTFLDVSANVILLFVTHRFTRCPFAPCPTEAGLGDVCLDAFRRQFAFMTRSSEEYDEAELASITRRKNRLTLDKGNDRVLQNDVDKLAGLVECALPEGQEKMKARREAETEKRRKATEDELNDRVGRESHLDDTYESLELDRGIQRLELAVSNAKKVEGVSILAADSRIEELKKAKTRAECREALTKAMSEVEDLDWKSPSDEIEKGIRHLNSVIQQKTQDKRPSLVDVLAKTTAQERILALQRSRVRALKRELEAVMNKLDHLRKDSSSSDLFDGIGRLNRAIGIAKKQLDRTRDNNAGLMPLGKSLSESDELERAVRRAESRLETLKKNHYTAIAREGRLELEAAMQKLAHLSQNASSQDLTDAVERLTSAIATARTKGMEDSDLQNAVSTAKARLAALKKNLYTAVAREGRLELQAVVRKLESLSEGSSSQALDAAVTRLASAIATARTKGMEDSELRNAVSTAETRLAPLKMNLYTALAREGKLELEGTLQNHEHLGEPSSSEQLQIGVESLARAIATAQNQATEIEKKRQRLSHEYTKCKAEVELQNTVSAAERRLTTMHGNWASALSRDAIAGLERTTRASSIEGTSTELSRKIAQMQNSIRFAYGTQKKVNNLLQNKQVEASDTVRKLPNKTTEAETHFKALQCAMAAAVKQEAESELNAAVLKERSLSASSSSNKIASGIARLQTAITKAESVCGHDITQPSSVGTQVACDRVTCLQYHETAAVKREAEEELRQAVDQTPNLNDRSPSRDISSAITRLQTAIAEAKSVRGPHHTTQPDIVVDTSVAKTRLEELEAKAKLQRAVQSEKEREEYVYISTHSYDADAGNLPSIGVWSLSRSIGRLQDAMKEAKSVSRNISTYDAEALVREMTRGIDLLVYLETSHMLKSCIDANSPWDSIAQNFRYNDTDKNPDTIDLAIRYLEVTISSAKEKVQKAQQELRDRGLGFETVKGCEHVFKHADETISRLKDLRRTCE